MSRPKNDKSAVPAKFPAAGAAWKALRIRVEKGDTGTVARFAKRLGESKSTYQGWEAGRHIAPISVVPKVLAVDPRADISALAGEPARRVTEAEAGYAVPGLADDDLLGELGKRLARPPVQAAEVRWVGDRDAVTATEGEDAYEAVPFAEDAAAAGPGRLMSDEIGGYVMIHAGVMQDARGAVVCVRVNGVSMQPTLPDRSIVAFDLGRRDVREAEGRVVLVRTEEGNVIKRSRLQDHHVLLYSDSPDQETWKPLILEPAEVDAGALLGTAFWAWVDLR